jgi:hypothetical protein
LERIFGGNSLREFLEEIFGENPWREFLEGILGWNFSSIYYNPSTATLFAQHWWGYITPPV